jgi:hypothetical protein
MPPAAPGTRPTAASRQPPADAPHLPESLASQVKPAADAGRGDAARPIGAATPAAGPENKRPDNLLHAVRFWRRLPGSPRAPQPRYAPQSQPGTQPRPLTRCPN